MSLRQFIQRSRATVRDKLMRERIGPYDRAYSKLIFGASRLRDAIASEPSQEVQRFLRFCTARMMQSHAQIFQDLFVAWVLQEKRHGFFCEFGATNGVLLSNSCYLERELAWSGICAEPARGWHDELKRNRPNTRIDTRCVWSKSGEVLQFKETAIKEHSTIGSFSDADTHSRRRIDADSYGVETISLNDLLQQHEAPPHLDYLSLDTEGSELEILRSLDFDRFRPRIVTVEHNYTPARTDILALLQSHGYQRVLTECSLFDDWYLEAGLSLPA
jgi:FkbM family methyltransferase